MNSIGMAFLLTALAGLSTMLGTIPILIKLKNERKIIAGSLSFAAGVMICVSVTDLVPEAIGMLEINFNGVITVLLAFAFIMIGMVISSLLDTKLVVNNKNSSLYKVGIISMLAIILHNIPEGISISVPIYYATNSRWKALVYTFISGLSEPLGAILTYLFLLPFINDIVLGLLFALIAGIMLHISFTELLPTSVNYREERITKFFFIVGIMFMLLKIFF